MVGGGIGNVKEGTDNNEDIYKSKMKNMQATVSLGLNYNINDRIGLEMHYGSFGVNSFVHYYDQSAFTGGRNVVSEVGFNFDKSTFRLGVNCAL